MFSDATNRAVATLLPGDWPYMLASLLANTASRGRGAVLVVPDHRDVARVRAALAQLLSPSQFVALTADLGPAARYREFLRISRGQARCVVGTRAAIWAPVHDLGLVAVWDDGDDLHAEPRAPYCHAREVGVARAHLADASLLLAGHAMSAEGALLVESGWARILRPSKAAAVATLPAMRASGDDDELARDAAARAARLPSLAWHAARDALAADAPVLVQVPRRGYQLSLLCQSCRKSARCSRCAGPLARPGAHAVPACRWCNIAAVDWTCPSCGSHQLRAAVVGAARTAEELGRAFPGVTVRISGGDHIIADVPTKAQLVVATPGAEPLAAGGYGAALLLDGWALLARPELRAGEEALRRWLNAAALVRNAAGGGRVVVVAAGEMRPVQALLRWRPDWHAARELDDRAALHLPPAGRIAAVTGAAGAVNELLELAELPAHAELLGPVEIAGRGDEREQRMLIRVPRGDGAALAATLRQSAAARSARKSAGAVRIEIDPLVLG
jgi:primosomal protein N' (replication factor Y)